MHEGFGSKSLTCYNKNMANILSFRVDTSIVLVCSVVVSVDIVQSLAYMSMYMYFIDVLIRYCLFRPQKNANEFMYWVYAVGQPLKHY